jgi:hypothetical protein
LGLSKSGIRVEGTLDPEEARKAFIAATREVGVFVREVPAGGIDRLPNSLNRHPIRFHKHASANAAAFIAAEEGDGLHRVAFRGQELDPAANGSRTARTG